MTSHVGERPTEPLYQAFRHLRRQGQLEPALGCLREGLARGLLTPQETIQAGRLLLRDPPDERDGRVRLKVSVFGQFTTTWLMSGIAAVGVEKGLRLDASEGNYDTVLQDLASLREEPDVVVLVPWNQRLLSESEGAGGDRMTAELDFWSQAWSLVPDHTRVVQVGYDWVHTGAMGHHLGFSREGHISRVRRINEALTKELPQGAFFVDLEQVSGLLGRQAFYDMRGYFWSKQPLSDQGTILLAEHLVAGIQAILTGPKKVLVVDLDNTLWGGIVGEAGALGIDLGKSPAGEAYRYFQSYLKDLSGRGCLLAVCSKNNTEDATEPFERNGDMVLSLDDFSAFEATWEPKASVLERIASTLQLDLRDFVFFDDNPAEREQVRQALPEVAVVDVPEDPSDYVTALERGLWFEATQLTQEDHARTERYRTEARRRESSAKAGSLDDYLRSLEMRAEVSPVEEKDLDRVVQLIGKTNQFNLTTRRHSANVVRRMLSQPGTLGLVMRMGDRFGDHGLISVILALVDPDGDKDTLRVDTWLMSCRVIGRTAEQFLFNLVLRQAQDGGYSRLRGEYIPTKKNGMVADLYPDLGFESIPTLGDSQFYQLDLSVARPCQTFVEARTPRS